MAVSVIVLKIRLLRWGEIFQNIDADIKKIGGSDAKMATFPPLFKVRYRTGS